MTTNLYYRGTIYLPQKGGWFASVKLHRGAEQTGPFPTQEQAARERDRILLHLCGIGAHRLNFPVKVRRLRRVRVADGQGEVAYKTVYSLRHCGENLELTL